MVKNQIISAISLSIDSFNHLCARKHLSPRIAPKTEFHRPSFAGPLTHHRTHAKKQLLIFPGFEELDRRIKD
jgi:hypothetical protein